MSFLDENEWAQTLLRMINEMERPDYVRAQLDSQPYNLHVQFVESTMSSDPPIKLYSIYTIGRLLTGKSMPFLKIRIMISTCFVFYRNHPGKILNI